MSPLEAYMCMYTLSISVYSLQVHLCLQGPYFAPAYEPLPSDVRFLYNGNPMRLSEKAEEAAGFFAKMLDHDYTTKDVFCKNFFQDWRKVCVCLCLYVCICV